MSLSAPELGVPPDAWVSAAVGFAESVEIVDGEFVVRRLGGNPHHYVARRLAEEFERQWPGVTASAPGNWALRRTADGQILLGRVPDVLIDGDGLVTDEVFTGVPDAVVEVWSPGNTLAEMNTKRGEYRAAGLPVLLEVFLTDSRDVHLEWTTNDEGLRWTSTAVAAGEQPLCVAGPRPFSTVPNDLLRRRSAG